MPLLGDVPSSKGAVALLAIVLSSVYLDRYLAMGSTVLFAVIIISLETMNPSLPIVETIMQLVFMVFALLAMTVLIIWVRSLVKNITEQEKASEAMVAELESVLELIRRNTVSLDENVVVTGENMTQVKGSSGIITNALEEMSRGIASQTENVQQISDMMGEANGHVSEISGVGSALADVSQQADRIVAEGLANMGYMNEQMTSISNSTSRSVATVEALEKSMEEVNNFLTVITQIASQTNLLALNAAIEAARAGEAGKGFAVVAEEVRKLSEESTSTVAYIGGIIEGIKSQTEEVLGEVNRSRQAATEGVEKTALANESFEEVRSSFRTIDSHIGDTLNRVEAMTEMFARINEETSGIAAVSEEHAATTQEISSTMSEQNSAIEGLHDLIENINRASRELGEVVR